MPTSRTATIDVPRELAQAHPELFVDIKVLVPRFKTEVVNFAPVYTLRYTAQHPAFREVEEGTDPLPVYRIEVDAAGARWVEVT